MNQIKSENRTASLIRMAHDWTSYDSCLYIGAREDRHDYMPMFGHMKLTVVEAYKDNCNWLLTVPYVARVIHADIRGLDFGKDKFDVVFWWHGPEHIEQEELPKIINNLESVANKLIIMGCPWGNVRQKKIYGNPYEEHLSFLDEGFFEERGYEVECLGKKNKSGNNITAVKYV